MFDMVPFKRTGLLKKGGNNFNNFMDNFFNEDFFAPIPFEKMGFGFKVDLKENENSYVVEADLPGVDKESIDIQYKNNYLTVSAKREDKTEEKKENYVRKEIKYGEFKRSFYVDNVDEEKVTAVFKDGVLRIELPKVEKSKVETKKIEIK
ncbi:MAG: heat shock protein Hsp18 [Solirubrobacterales bacterium]